MSKPRALDLFCGAGGASMGLHLAGFDVTGVDIRHQSRYPFTFIQADALTVDLDGYDFIWASPPCQAFSSATAMKGIDRRTHPDLIDATRQRLIASKTAYVIENVPAAPLLNAIMFCGTMFPPLRVFRHRLFEPSFAMFQPWHVKHPAGRVVNPPFRRGAPLGARLVAQRKASGMEDWVSVAGHSFIAAHGARAMGIDWMTRDELAQAIPPAYSRYIGDQALRAISRPAGRDSPPRPAGHSRRTEGTQKAG